MQNSNLPPLDFSGGGIPTFANLESTLVPIVMIAGIVLIVFAFSRVVCADPPENEILSEPPIFFKTRIR